ncbi:MAG: preprotein translocase subunit SecG [Dehalococcoidia bacterium]|tara:strand:- start:600 stop:818 length:219 start_codon:yes stop_codon:yes gene_type:complete
METSLNIVQIILSVVLITVILIQVRGSAGNLFGGGESSFRTRRGVDLVLFRFTIFVGVLFVLVSLFSVIIQR